MLRSPRPPCGGVQEAARAIGLQIQVLNATTVGKIDGAFASLAHDRADALFVAPDAFLNGRGVQINNLASRDRIPAVFNARQNAAAGGLMSYGHDNAETYRQVSVYAGKILNGAKPADRSCSRPSYCS